MKKKLTALLLCAALLIGCIPFASATTVETNYIMSGNYIYRLRNDADTSTAIPADFGTKAADGKIWTDKSVAENGNGFDITLSALAQEYEVTNSSFLTSSTAVDVAMAIDLTRSMSDDLSGDSTSTLSETKAFAMVKSLNDALDIIMKANPNNRAVVYGFAGNKTPQLLGTLGHYTNPKWTKTESYTVTSDGKISGKYFNLSGHDNCGLVPDLETNADLLCNEAAYPQVQKEIDGGTNTQQGIYASAEAMISAIKADTNKTQERVPYFLMFTDGGATYSYTKWYDLSSYTADTGDGSTPSAAISAQTILTAALEKEKISAAYDTFNGKHVEDVVWFNVGLIPEGDRDGFTVGLLKPSTIADGSNSKASNITSKIKDYTTNSYSSYSAYGNAEKYVYANDYVFYAETQTELDVAFTALANKIADRSKAVAIPVINRTATGSDALSNFIITDKIGKGTALDASTISLIPSIAPDVAVSAEQKSSESGTTVYGFTGYETTVTVTGNATDGYTVTTSVPPKEIGLFTENDDDTYNTSAPVRIKYSVKPSGLDGTKAYSNESATAEYYITNDDPYYYDITKNNVGGFAGSTLKDAFKNGETAAKAANVTGTKAFVSSSTFADGSVADACKVTTQLGNNGLIEPVVKITKTADKSGNVNPGDKVKFTIDVKNLTGDPIESIKISDPVPTGTTPVKDSKTTTDSNNSTINFGGSNDDTVFIVLNKLPANQTTEFTYEVTVPDNAEDGTEIIPKTPGITEVDGDDAIPGGDSVPDESLKITVENADEYSVSYSWTKAPESAVLPTDTNTYKVGASYTVDSTFTSSSVINTYDEYGNVNGKYTFSGWTDPGSGTMVKGGVTITGEWTYSDETVTGHSITYSWSGDIPQGKSVPTDSGSYVKNQPYTVDSTFTSSTVVNTYDEYGNVNGKYTFSGWTDPNEGKMGDSNVTITGEWTYSDETVTGHSITYSWSGDIPQGKSVPTDSNSYVKNQSYTVDSTFTSSTVVNTYDEYGNVNGKYTFSGWTDPNNGKMGDSNVTITGEWTYGDETVPTRSITYSWSGDIPQGKSVPTDNGSYVKNQPYTVDSTFTSSTTVNTYDEYGNITGCYSFSGWTDPNEGKMGDSNVTITGEWTYTPTTVDKHNITYTWTGDIPESAVKPTDSKDYVCGQSYTVDSTYTNGSTIDDLDEYGNVKGVYTFGGWTDPYDNTMPDTDVELVGVWSYEPQNVAAHTITYSWGGDVPSSAVLTNNSLSASAPADSNSYVKNQPFTVDSSFTSATIAYTYDTYGNVNGYYSFSGWDTASGKMGETDIEIKGTWTYQDDAPDTFNIAYSWNGDIPAGVSCPTDSNDYVNGQPYTIDTTYTSSSTVLKQLDENDGKKYDYSFSGWDKTDGTIDNAGVSVSGTWSRVESANDEVTYEWETPDGPSPDNIIGDPLPNPPSPEKVYKGDNIPDPGTEEFTVIVEKDDGQGGKNRFKFKFKKWKIPEEPMGDEPVTVIPEWEIEPITPFTLTYEFDGDAPATASVPTDSTKYYNGNTATLSNPPKTTIIDDQGKWTFNGWGKTSVTFSDDDITVTGTWNKENGKTVTYKNDENAPDSATVPTDNNVYYKGDPFEIPAGAAPAGKTVIERDKAGEPYKYTFNGWTPDGGVVGDTDVEVTGQWTKVPADTYNVTYSWSGDAPEGVQPPVDDFDYIIGETYTIKPVDNETVYTYVPGTSVPNGEWTFDGWNKNDGVIGEDDVPVTGTWTYTPYATHSVKYEWTGADLISGIVIPTDSGKYVKGQSYPVDKTYDSASFVNTYDAYGNVNGKYTFSGWTDSNEGVMGETDVTLTGVWTYGDVTVEKHSLSYKWSGNIPESVKLPDSADYYRNQPFTIDTTYPKNTIIYTYDAYGNTNGYYEFGGWDTASGKMGSEDITVNGVWTLIPVEVGQHVLRYDWGDIHPVDYPLPAGGVYVLNQPYELPSTPAIGYRSYTYDDYGNQTGYYEFTGWNDPNGGIMGEDNATITGVWSFTPLEVPTRNVTFKDDNGNEHTVINGQIIRVVPQGGNWSFNGRACDPFGYEDITVTENISIDEPTKDGYRFGGWTVTHDASHAYILTAKWEKNCNILNYIVPAVIIATPCILIGSAVTTVAVAGGTIAAIEAGKALIKHIKENVKDNNNGDNGNEPSETDVDIPDTGSNDIMSAAFSGIIALAGGVAVLAMTRKKKHEDKEDK